ncbi:Fe-S cluster assembly protein SufD [Solilutibacter silvestris]|uniref:SufD: FeS assembly protein SufD n=1 Tax=Solilutibacter silvestris TaxID=1645665 RepID=A0A2K1Q2Y5_9GAMM|nr:Fe-S cluster assembly protein SufD [Lysobacter silvestris]PNS09409.1 sufD: FeS assembly protein SufD [Lysobacter silvestris]
MSALSDSFGVDASMLPTAREEAWRSMPLRALERRAFAAATRPAASSQLLADIPAPRLVFVHGRVDETLCDLSGLAAGITIEHATPADDSIGVRTSAFARSALAQPATEITLAPASTARLHIVELGLATTDAELWHQHLRITLGEHANLALIEYQGHDGTHSHFANGATSINLAPGASMQHARIVDDPDGATRFLHTEVTVAAKAHYARFDLELGAALSRHELHIQLDGTEATTAAHGALLGSGKRHVETRMQVVHAARDTRSDLQWRGLAADRSRVVMHGGIRIDAGADGSDARLSNRNLLLSDNAEIDTQPVLVIHADEVKAAHGATVGQLDTNALFYLRSRGLPETQARRMLTTAFVQSLLSQVDDDAVRGLLEQRLSSALQRLNPEHDA